MSIADDVDHGTYRFCVLDNLARVGDHVGAGVVPSSCSLWHDVSIRLLPSQQLRHPILCILFVPAQHGTHHSIVTVPKFVPWLYFSQSNPLTHIVNPL